MLATICFGDLTCQLKLMKDHKQFALDRSPFNFLLTKGLRD